MSNGRTPLAPWLAPLLAPLLASAAAGLIACGGADTPLRTPSDREATSVQEWNARARAGARTEERFGTHVEDPFALLEEESPLTEAWIDWQSARTSRAIESWERPGTRERLAEVLRIGSIGRSITRGGLVFYTKRDGDREQPALFVRALSGDDAAGERILVDPTSISVGSAAGNAALDWYFPSPRGRYVAFGISRDGDERSTLYVMETASGRILDEAIPHTKWTDVTWLDDEAGFYYRRYPSEGEADWDEARVDSYNPKLFFHRLGTPHASDPLVYAPSDPTYFATASVSDDDRYVAIVVARGWSASDLLVFDRGERADARVVAPDTAHALVPVRVGREHLYDASILGGRLLVFTNEDAPKYRILSTPIASVFSARASGGSAAEAPEPALDVLVPESDATLDGFASLGARIALHELVDVRSRVRLIDLAGADLGEVALPSRGEVSSFSGDAESGALVVTFSSFVQPPALLALQGAERALTPIVSVESPVDPSTLAMEVAHVTSRDGTQVPVTLVHRRDVTANGERPVLLYGYGGFNVSILPSFARHPLYWIDRGGVYAVANLRGGGEFGEAWHQAGNLGQKERVFEDMEAAIRWLGGESGWSRPERVAILGGSNGGLLMGAMITRVPDTFRAAASYVGLYDMVRYHLFPPAEIWTSEYGSAEVEEQFRWLYGYSPYHRVRDGQPMPYVLVETAANDTRVYWGHSTKFAARLQEATGEADPHVWFYREAAAGHGAGTPLSTLVDRYTRMYAFLEHALGVAPEGASE